MKKSVAFVLGLLLALAFLIAACAKPNTVPTADDVAAPPPDLSGLTVMILPAQAPPAGTSIIAGRGEPVAGLDAELAFFLAEQAPRVSWVTSETVKQATSRAPSLQLRPEALAVSAFHYGRVRRVGDPLWGDLRNLGVLLNARYAVLPFAAGYAPDSVAPNNGRVEIGAAVIDTGNGNVLWTGYAAGDRGPQGSRAVIASAARALALKIAP